MADTRVERRNHKRHPLPCPARLVDETGTYLASGKTVNISDGGLLMPFRLDALTEAGTQVDVKLSIPRTTPNTCLMQPFKTQAYIVRSEADDEGNCHIAVRFQTPIDLDLEV